MKNSRISVYQADTPKDTDTLLKSQHTKFSSQPLTLDSGRGKAEQRQSRLELYKESLGFVALRRELKGQLTGSLC